MANSVFTVMGFKPVAGGLTEHAHQMVKHLTELGEHVTVLTPYRPDVSEDLEFDATCNYPVTRFETKVSSGEWKGFEDLRKRLMFRDVLQVIRSVEADYVVSSGGSFLPTTSVSLAARIAGIPHFAFVHHITPLSHGVRRVLEDLKFTACSLVLCVSNDTACNVIKSGVPSHKVYVIPNGVDWDHINLHRGRSCNESSSRLDAYCPSGAPILLTVSRLVKYKGVQRVIEAMPKILAEVPDTRYVVVGDGEYMEDLIRLARKSPARDSIIFLGPLSDDEKFACYKRCSVFVMPSEIEGFGMVYLEANAFGKAVIGGDIMGVPDAVVNEETGLLVEPSDVNAIANAAIRLLRNPDEARRLGENGRRRVQREFTWKVSAERFLDVTRVVLGQKH